LSEKQRKFVGAELARKRMGKKTHRPVTYRDRDYVSKRVVFETIFTLQRHYRVLLPQIKDLLLPIFDLRGFLLPWKHLCIAALNLFVEHNISLTKRINQGLRRERFAL
jgi:hypothetical protein